METQTVASKSWHILVVDDRPEEAEPLVECLHKQDWQVNFVTSGKQALARIAANDIHAILCDLEMPDMGGYEVLESVGSNPQTRRVLFFLTNSEWNQNNWSRRAGGRSADCHFIKPYTERRLLEIVSLLNRFFEHWNE